LLKCLVMTPKCGTCKVGLLPSLSLPKWSSSGCITPKVGSCIEFSKRLTHIVMVVVPYGERDYAVLGQVYKVRAPLL